MNKAITILKIDSLAGLAVGALTLALTPLLVGSFFAWPIEYVYFIGGANVIYGCFSGSLLLMYRRTGRLSAAGVILLIIANSAWAGQCFAQIWWLSQGDEPAILLLAHMGLEAVFVAVLAFQEAKYTLPAID
ncbi:MAG: hypothetical protein RIF32_12470 [Leptospirales bacterium]|jgi:hypothetical protein